METLELNQNQIAEKIGKSRTRFTMTLGILENSWRNVQHQTLIKFTLVPVLEKLSAIVN